eukprot:TRINITY_DN1380_c0_g1_i2.p5 TRINITY_DN1380_c0_g1~~TRINITY_DN1380_c0_g1_i2.p5  ORF type:complete len:259 (+),score=45.89 TRINITY_DN1380_c0_g1_i2:2612-3388(+)
MNSSKIYQINSYKKIMQTTQDTANPLDKTDLHKDQSKRKERSRSRSRDRREKSRHKKHHHSRRKHSDSSESDRRRKHRSRHRSRDRKQEQEERKAKPETSYTHQPKKETGKATVERKLSTESNEEEYRRKVEAQLKELEEEKLAFKPREVFATQEEEQKNSIEILLPPPILPSQPTEEPRTEAVWKDLKENQEPVDMDIEEAPERVEAPVLIETVTEEPEVVKPEEKGLSEVTLIKEVEEVKKEEPKEESSAGQQYFD